MRGTVHTHTYSCISSWRGLSLSIEAAVNVPTAQRPTYLATHPGGALVIVNFVQGALRCLRRYSVRLKGRGLGGVL